MEQSSRGEKRDKDEDLREGFYHGFVDGAERLNSRCHILWALVCMYSSWRVSGDTFRPAAPGGRSPWGALPLGAGVLLLCDLPLGGPARPAPCTAQGPPLIPSVVSDRAKG